MISCKKNPREGAALYHLQKDSNPNEKEGQSDEHRNENEEMSIKIINIIINSPYCRWRSV